MKYTHAVLAAALLAGLSAPAFAQGAAGTTPPAPTTPSTTATKPAPAPTPSTTATTDAAKSGTEKPKDGEPAGR